MAENIKWYYDEVMSSKGNKVIVRAHKTSVAIVTQETGYVYRSQLNKESIDAGFPLDGDNHQRAMNSVLTISLSTPLTEERAMELYKQAGGDKEWTKGFIGTGTVFRAACSAVTAVGTNYSYNNSIPVEAFVASMSELSLNVNNQWIEGNGADSMFTGAVDAMAQLSQAGAVASLTNTADSMGYSSKVINALKKWNQVHYKSSTQFMKAFKGTNVSIPVAINRTFVYDDYNTLHDDEIAMILGWSLGDEIDLGQWTDTDDLKGKTADKGAILSALGNVSQSVVNYMTTVGGVIQKAPLGYVYNAAYWKKMMNPKLGVLPGTISIEMPNGIKIADLLISDLSVQMSNTQVLTCKGLRPLTVTIAIQFMPARTWGMKDAKEIINYGGADLTKTFTGS